MQVRSDRTLKSRSPHYRWLSEAGVGQASGAQVCDRPRVYHDEGRLWELRAMHVVM